jgi:predicted aldo/keto reductase-like oxidoreductase
MNNRILGRTGLKVSEIGLGCEGFVGKDAAFAKELFAFAFENGINCMDLYTPDPLVHRFVANALKGRRGDLIMQAHLCTIWENEQYLRTLNPKKVQHSFETMLKNLQTDYVDIGMLHYIDSLYDWREIADGHVMQYALRQKQAGYLGHIGVSSHNPQAALAAVESGLIDVLMFSVNPCYDLLPPDENCETLWAGESYNEVLDGMDPQRRALYETCQRLGVGITAMKAFGGGDLLNETLSPAGKALTPVQCIHYALTRPAVACVMAGVHSIEQLSQSLAYQTATPQQKDFAAAFAVFPRMSWRGHCMYCGHCAPCPVGIDVAAVTKFLNLAKAQGFVPETVREHYKALSHKAGECVSCGDCQARCPFEVPSVQNMQQATEMFGS